MMHEKFYKLIEETSKLSKRLENKSDECLVEDIFYSMQTTDLPSDCSKILNKYMETKILTKKGRKKLEGLYKLLFSDKILEE